MFAQLESGVKIAWQFLCSCHQCLLCEIQNMKKRRQQNRRLDHCDLSGTILALGARNSLNISGTNSLIKIKYTYPLCKCVCNDLQELALDPAIGSLGETGLRKCSIHTPKWSALSSSQRRVAFSTKWTSVPLCTFAQQDKLTIFSAASTGPWDAEWLNGWLAPHLNSS